MKYTYDYSKVNEWYLNDNIPVFEIAKRVGCGWRAIYHHLERSNIQRRTAAEARISHYNAEHEQYKDQIISLYNDGNSASEIARQLRMSANTVQRMIERFGLPRRKMGDTKRDKTSNWKGGYKSWHGYIRVRMPEHPYAATDGYVPQHRLVMEQHLGRYLLPNEHVHHKDGNKSNNVLENLTLISPANHMLVTEFCKKCPLKKEVIKLERQLKQAQQTCQLMLEQQSNGKLYIEAAAKKKEAQ